MKAPDYRAILGPTGFHVVPWTRGLALSVYALEPQRRNPLVEALSSPEQQDTRHYGPDAEHFAALEVWSEPARLRARHLGSFARERAAAAAALVHWARDELDRPVVFGPDLPDWLGKPGALRVVTVKSDIVPAFRFTFPPEPLLVCPWGRGAPENTQRLRASWQGALGDIVAVDDEHALARFATGSRLQCYDTKGALQRWARADGWQLDFLDGIHPLLDPEPAPELLTPGRCGRCGAASSQRGMAYGMFVTRQGYESTLCRICGGRLYWHVRR